MRVQNLIILPVHVYQVGVLAKVCGYVQDPGRHPILAWHAPTPGKRLCCAPMAPLAKCCILFSVATPFAGSIFAALWAASLFFFEYFFRTF